MSKYNIPGIINCYNIKDCQLLIRNIFSNYYLINKLKLSVSKYNIKINNYFFIGKDILLKRINEDV